jgi:hypothetical protein
VERGKTRDSAADIIETPLTMIDDLERQVQVEASWFTTLVLFCTMSPLYASCLSSKNQNIFFFRQSLALSHPKKNIIRHPQAAFSPTSTLSSDSEAA